jgi:subfamily B ATP-binding cassette protein MsbA
MAKPSQAFWSYARGLLRYPRALTGAIVMAFVSAGSLGAGLLGAKPILDIILGDPANPRDLTYLARSLNDRMLASGSSLRIPDGVIEALPIGPFTAAVWLLAGIFVLSLLGACANFLHTYFSLTIVQRVVTNLRRHAFAHALKLPVRDVVTAGVSDILTHVQGDTQNLGQGFNAMLSKALAQITKGIGALFAAFWLDWRLAGIGILMTPILYHAVRKLGKKIRRASRSAMENSQRLQLMSWESLAGLRVVKVYTTERFESGRFNRMNTRVMRDNNHIRTARALASPVTEVLSLVILGSLGLIAIKAIIDGHLDPKDFALTLGSLAVAGAALKPLTGIINDIQASYASADRLQQFFARPLEPGHDPALPRIARHTRSVEFKDISLTYAGAARPALRAIDLSIPAGATYAFVGPNGCGKTTLLSLVPRLFDPDQGAVLIDGTDIRGVNVRSLRRQIGIVTQDTVMFRTSVARNIAYGSPGAGRDAIIAAAKQARAHDFVERLPDGYDTVLAEGGHSLSGGQRQRLAIARAILRNPALLILDEATSMIDAESEHKIAEAISEFAKSRTCLVVAHRLSTVLAADRIVVLDDGRIVDVGRHSELLVRCDLYQRLVRGQLIAQEPPAGEATPATVES